MRRYLRATINDEICSPACGSLNPGTILNYPSRSSRLPYARQPVTCEIDISFFFQTVSYAKRKRYFFMGPTDGSERDLWPIAWYILIFQNFSRMLKIGAYWHLIVPLV